MNKINFEWENILVNTCYKLMDSIPKIFLPECSLLQTLDSIFDSKNLNCFGFNLSNH